MFNATSLTFRFSDRHTRSLGYCVLGVGITFYFYEYLLRIAPSVMLMELKQHYQLNDYQLAQLSATYYYIYAPMQLPVGIIADRYGPLLCLFIACIFCAFGSHFFVCTQSLALATLGRFLVGLGSAFAFVCVLKTANHILPEYFAFVSSITMALGQIGALCGDVLLSYYIEQHGWRLANYYVFQAGVLLSIVMGVIFYTYSCKKPLASEGSTTDSASSIFRELCGVFRRQHMWVICIIGLIMCLPLVVFAEYLSIDFLKAHYHFTATDAAQHNSIFFLGMAIGGPSMVALAHVIDSYRATLGLGACLSTSILSLILSGNVHSSFLYPLLFFLGFSTSAKVIVFPLAKELSNSDCVASVVAFINMFVMFAGIIFQPISGYLLNASSAGVYTGVDYINALYYIPVVLALVPLLTLLLPRVEDIVENALETKVQTAASTL